MSNKLRAVCSAIVALLAVHCSLAAEASGQDKPGGWLQHWRNATISFGRTGLDHNRPFFQVIGTGFLIGMDERTGYIVTAKHVFDDASDNWHPAEINIRFAWQERDSVYSNLGRKIRLRDNFGPLWKAASDGSDIAAIPLDPASSDVFPWAASGRQRKVEAIGLVELADESWLFEGAPVIVLGYPGIVGNEYLVRAVSRGGIVAWTNPEAAFDNKFLVDANLYPGNSGSPVIAVPSAFVNPRQIRIGGGGMLLGLVSKGPVQDLVVTAGGQPVTVTNPNLPQPVQLQTQIRGVGSFGVIEPASKIAMLLKSLQSSSRTH